MTIHSRWSEPVPHCSLHQWIFGSSQGPVKDYKAFIDADRPDTHFLTKADYRLLSKRVALGLQDAGLRAGERVLLFSGNSIYFPSVFLGILMAGGIFTGANPTYVARELAYQLKDSEASFMLTAESRLPAALEAAQEAGLPRDRIYVFGCEELPSGHYPPPGVKGRRDGCRHWTELLQGNKSRAETWDWAEPADPGETTCCLNYSSGTTGVPKGVEITHRAYVANGAASLANHKRMPDAEAYTERAKGLAFLPMYHAYAQTFFIANFPHWGSEVYVMSGYDFEKMLQHIERFRITTLTCVPPIVVSLAKSPLTKKYDLSSVEGIGSGAAPLAREVAEEVERNVLKGLAVRQGWGMTEITCSCMGWTPDSTAKSAAVGELIANCSGRIMDLDGVTEITEPGKTGELWVSGPNLMKGYWRRPEATASTISVDPDGTRWLRTGDVAYVEKYEPGGFFHVVDRIKELIKVKGLQVAPAELEATLLDRADIADAAVVGVTIKGEEVPRAYLVKSEGARVTESEVARWMESRVSRHKRLTGGVVFVNEVPKNPSGKILRKILRDRARKEVGDSESRNSRL